MKLFKRAYLKKLWVAVIVIVVISFIIGQFALYLLYAF